MTREYYFNNAGRQMMLLGESVTVRYLELLGEPVEFPEEGYHGEYIVDDRPRAARRSTATCCGTSPRPAVFKQAAERAIFATSRRP